MARHKPQGSYTVSGPFEEDHPVPTVSAGMSVAQTFASRNRKKASVLTYYVRTITGEAKAMIVLADGIIHTASMS